MSHWQRASGSVPLEGGYAEEQSPAAVPASIAAVLPAEAD